MKKFRSYVPELTFGEQKQQMPARVCREDFAVIDPTNQYRILTGRGRETHLGQALPKAWKIPKTEIEWLERALFLQRRALLDTPNGPVLIFADVLEPTGMLLAMRPYMDAPTFLRGLRYLGMRGIAVSPTMDAYGGVTLTEESVMQISELFYYMDRILDSDNRFEIGLWTRMHLIANFVGCRLTRVDLPISDPTTSRVERARLTVFWVCALLELRKINGDVCAGGEEEIACFRCSVELIPIGRLLPIAREHKNILSMPDLPAFRNFTLRREGGKLILDAFLQDVSKSAGLHSTLADYICWRISLDAA